MTPQLSARAQPSPQRMERPISCEKPETPGCLSRTGEGIVDCSRAPQYSDAAVPAAEQYCPRKILETRINTVDPYKRQFMEVCQALDETLATPHMPPELLALRFHRIETLLDRIIVTDSRDIDITEAGRLPFYLNARLLDAGLGLYYHRALHNNQPYDARVMKGAQAGYVQLLQEFLDGRYDEHMPLVAHNKIEIEIAALLGRGLDARNFPMVALHREEASATRGFNHDLLIYNPTDGKIPIQIKNAHYRYSNGKSHEDEYAPDVALIVYSDLVEWRESPRSLRQVFEHRVHNDLDIHIPYEEYDPDHRTGIRWFVDERSPSNDDTPPTEPLVFVQSMMGKRDGLSDLIVAEANSDLLTLHERNLLNAASHLLVAHLNRVRGVRRRRTKQYPAIGETASRRLS